MGDDPVVSIVLPTYNGSRYLEEAVQSIVEQTLTDWELIIVDDCSTDETPQIVAQFVRQDPRIRGIRHAANRNLPAALNTGFSAARGRYRTWTSDDNRYRPQALATMSAYLDGHPDVGLVYAAMALIDEAGAEIGLRDLRPPEALWEENTVDACFLYRREVQTTVGPYDEQLFCAEDYDFWLRVSCRFKLAALDQNLYCYREHGDSLTSTQYARVWHSAKLALNKSLPNLYWATPAQKRCAHLQLTGWALSCDRLWLARWHFVCSLPASLPWLFRQHRYAIARLLVGQWGLSLLRKPGSKP